MIGKALKKVVPYGVCLQRAHTHTPHTNLIGEYS